MEYSNIRRIAKLEELIDDTPEGKKSTQTIFFLQDDDEPVPYVTRGKLLNDAVLEDFASLFYADKLFYLDEPIAERKHISVCKPLYPIYENNATLAWI